MQIPSYSMPSVIFNNTKTISLYMVFNGSCYIKKFILWLYLFYA